MSRAFLRHVEGGGALTHIETLTKWEAGQTR
jgi:hypothetical protein